MMIGEVVYLSQNLCIHGGFEIQGLEHALVFTRVKLNCEVIICYMGLMLSGSDNFGGFNSIYMFEVL